MATRVIPTERQIEQVHARYHLALVGLALIAAGLTMLVLFMIIGPMFATWLIKANISMLYSGVIVGLGFPLVDVASIYLIFTGIVKLRKSLIQTSD